MRINDLKDHFTLIVNSSQQGITSCDTQGIITSWNKGAEQIFGYLPEEVIGKPLSIFLPPEVDPLEQESNIRRCLQADFTPPYEVCRLHKSGKRIYIYLSISRLKNQHGEVIGFCSVFGDVTARKDLEEKFINQYLALEKANKKLLEQQKSLKAINRRLQLFYDHSPDLSAIVDLDSGNVLSCNASFCQFLNTSREKAIGSNIYSFHAQESYNVLYNTLLELETHAKVSKYQDLFLLNSTYEKVPASLTANAAFANQNQKVVLICWHLLGYNQGRKTLK